MAKDSSFDIESEVNEPELENALNMARKEIASRFDFKGSNSSIEKDGDTLLITTEDNMRLSNIRAILEEKLAKRSVDLKFFEFEDEQPALGGNVKQNVKIKNGITKEKAKDIVKTIKDSKLKVNAQIQDNIVRVSSAKKDALQETMQVLRQANLGIVLQFTNYR